MDALEEVASRLAERVAPDEVELAPTIAQAAAQGGPDWRRAQQASGGALHGGVIPGAESASDFTLILGALKDCASLLSNFCVIGSASLSIALGWRSLRGGGQKIGAAAEQDRAIIERTVETLLRELEKRGLGGEKAERITDSVLVTLAEQPEHGRRFAEALGRTA